MYIIHVVEPLAGGMVTFMKSLTESMPSDQHLIIHGRREHGLPLEAVRKQFIASNIKLVLWESAVRNLSPLQDLHAARELYVLLKQLKAAGKIDVVHLHCSKAGFIGRLVCRLLGLQHLVFYTPNGAPFASGTSTASNFLYKQLEKLAHLFGGQIVCCSPSEQLAYEKAGMPSIAINNGIPYEKIKRTSENRAPGNRGFFEIITVGRIVDQKNPALFNRIAQWCNQFPQIRFVWVGEGADRNILTSPNIEITGWLPEHKVHRRVSEADVYLSTARYEGLPFAALEALALQKPMLLTNCTGNADLVNGLNGGVFSHWHEAVNKILRFYNNHPMLRMMGQQSGRYCKYHFNFSETFSHYRRLYSKVAGVAS